jgi:hypothetical protein
MTIRIIRTKPIWSEMQIWAITNNGKMEKKGEVIKPLEKIWECVGEYLIIKVDGGELKYVVDYGNDGSIAFSLSEIEWGIQKQDLITIKGISDTES